MAQLHIGKLLASRLAHCPSTCTTAQLKQIIDLSSVPSASTLYASRDNSMMQKKEE